VNVLSHYGPSDSISWEVAPFSWSAAQRLARELRLPFTVANVLAARGLVDPEEARTFLECSAPLPDPFLLADMAAAVESISAAIENRRRVVIHGDYDADGITATALMVLGLREFGVDAEWYLPSRFVEGFGLSAQAAETIAAKGPGLLITVDCGVNYPAEVSLAQSLGLDVIVVDHHQPGPQLPACPLIHPVRGDYPSDDLCGVGLAFKLLHALHVSLRGAETDRVPDALHGLLDLVAVGTIADLAPLRGENRYYAKEGLKLLTIGTRPGLRALSVAAGCVGAVDSGAVAFRLAPRLNAAGRMADAKPPLRLLLTDDESQARAIAEELHELNGARQDVERRILEEASAQAEALDTIPPVLVLSGEGWHEGVVGIVASRLVERYHRPVLLLGERDGVAKGSGRSIPPYDLMSGLNACSQWLTMYGGHTQAVGVTLPTRDVGCFREAMIAHAASALDADDLRPVYRADAVLRGEEIDADTALALASLGPFGSGNPRPRLMLVDATVRQAEVTRTGGHLRCLVEVDGAKARAIGFSMGHRADELRQDATGRVLGVQLRVDEWQGTQRPEFLIDRIGSGRGEREDRAAVRCGLSCPHCHPIDDIPRIEGRFSCTCSAEEGFGSSGGRVQGPLVLPSPQTHDRRGQHGRLSAVAQVLSTGAPCLILACSISHCMEELVTGLPMDDLVRGGLQCVGRGCSPALGERVETAQVVIAEWDASRLQDLLHGREHVVVLDPPYRAEHAALLHGAVKRGSFVHLCYGDDQREATAGLLRYLVHPRFAMVCMYRAQEQGLAGVERRRMAAELAWRKGGVVLGVQPLLLAEEVLESLDLERRDSEGDRILLESIPAYAQAAADYEECSRLCRIL
jgi:single-stranded-DNA-specific exonuclease